MKLTVDVTGKSDAEIAQLAKNDASKLTVEELLYAATLTENLAEKATLYTKVTDLHKDCTRGWNNLAVVKYRQGNIADASRLFNKALDLNSQNPDANYNAGLIALVQNDLAKAEVFLGKAANTKGNLSNALGTVYVLKGDYAKAKSTYGSAMTNNAAIMQILDKNYSAARNTLTAVGQPDALTSYLAAVVAARTNDRDAVFSNLKAAIKADSAYATKAAKDIEFSKFFTDKTFISILR